MSGKTPEVNFSCRTCGNGLLLPWDGSVAEAQCSRCGEEAALTAPGKAGAPVERCAACGSESLFVQRDFNRKLGIAIIGVAAVFAPKTWGLSLLLAVLVDLGLYHVLPQITVCYACDAIHRGAPVNPQHQAYDHHVQEEFKVEKSQQRVLENDWRREHQI